MTEFYLYLFIASSAGLILWGLIQKERAYQYPFFMGSMFVSFILPQAFVLYENPEPASPEALQRLFLMSFLCVLMCWFGYQLSPNKNYLSKLNISINNTRLLQSATCLMIVGLFSKYYIGFVTLERAGHSNGLTGISTILWFFGNLLYISLAIFLMELLKKPNIQIFLLTVLAAYYPLRDIIYAGRRQPAMAFVLVIGLSFWFIKRSMPSRWFFAAVIAALIFLIPLFGANRQIVNDVISQDWEAVESSSERATETLREKNSLELKNAAILMDATSKTGRYGYGTAYWDALVFQFFPGQIFGRELKESMQLKLGLSHFKYFWGYRVVPGSTNTGIADSFAEFDYFGCLIFAVIGYFYKHLWIAANYYRSVFAQLLYIGLSSTAMVTVTHGTQRFFQEFFFQLIFVSIAIYYAKERSGIKMTSRSNQGLPLR